MRPADGKAIGITCAEVRAAAAAAPASAMIPEIRSLDARRQQVYDGQPLSVPAGCIRGPVCKLEAASNIWQTFCRDGQPHPDSLLLRART